MTAALSLLPAFASRAEDQFPATILHAGPVSLEFNNGELRYLYVGEREIVRRVYFAVRDDQWGTIPPVFALSEVKHDAESFSIRLEAECKNAAVDYAWKAKITGSSSGEIVFDVEGTAYQDFKSNRIGLCLLYGAGALAGQKFETVGEAGETKTGAFPTLVSPKLVAGKYRQLRYVAPNLMQVTAQMEGAIFSMEDQRNFGDSSFKAYSPLVYEYPSIPANASAHQRLSISILGAERGPERKEGLRITVGGPIAGAKIPKVAEAAPNPEPLDFVKLNANRETYAAQKTITFRFNPTTHLRDDEMIMENIPAVIDEVATIRSFATGASIRVDPVGFNSKVRGAMTDPRSEMPFGAAWCAAMLKALAVAGVEEAGFAVDGDFAHATQREIGAHAGAALLETKLEGAPRPPVEALGVADGGKRLVWLINRTSDIQEIDLVEGGVQAPLQPWEVRMVTLGK
jgi:hypothetical protein